MSLEEALAANTAAIEANTKVQTAILEKISTGGAKAEAPAEEKPKPSRSRAKPKPAEEKASEETETDETPDEPEEKPEPKKAAPKKAAPKKDAMAEMEVRTGIDTDALRDLARKFGSNDGGDKDERERLKGLMASAFDHLGAKKLSDLDDEDRVKFAFYLDHWIADSQAKLDFEALDEQVATDIEASDDDMLD